MKKKISGLFCGVLLLIMCFSLFSCKGNESSIDLWDSATYTENTELGEGAKIVEVEVKANDKSVTFKVNTDKETLGEALLEHKLISGEQGAYGIYIKSVNGITADYDTDQSYWSLSKNGEYMMTGADSEKISGGEHYELTYTK